jgi:hypothetical protein
MPTPSICSDPFENKISHPHACGRSIKQQRQISTITIKYHFYISQKQFGILLLDV